VELAMQRFKRVFGNNMKAENTRFSKAKNGSVDHCVCAKQNDQFRYAGLRKNLPIASQGNLLPEFSFIQQRPWGLQFFSGGKVTYGLTESHVRHMLRPCDYLLSS
jgi:hypothetical protein